MTVSQEEIQAAANAIKEAAAKHGAAHAEVLRCLEVYIELLRKAGRTAEVEKFQSKATLLRQALIAEGKLAPEPPAPAPKSLSSLLDLGAPAKPASPPAPKASLSALADLGGPAAKPSLSALADLGAAPAAKPAAPAPVEQPKPVEPAPAPVVEAPKPAPEPPKPAPEPEPVKPAPGPPKAEFDALLDLATAPSGSGFSLDDVPEDDIEIEILSGSSASSGAAKPAAAAAGGAPDPYTTDDGARILFNSNGEHIAVFFEGHIYSPDGRHVGRWDADLEAFLNRDGDYLGEICEDNRLLKDSCWKYRHMNFGDRGNEGNRAGWSRVGDINWITIPRGYEDVVIKE